MTVSTANTEAGRLAGDHSAGVARFLGIPYAAAPVGDLRFAPPCPPACWAGTRQATAYGPTAPRPALHAAHGVLAPLTGPGWVVGDGDFLNLNVWTPDPGTSGLPVMVYLHGGGFMLGSGTAPAFDATSLARDGVVLVTLNHRLGAEGFLALSGGSTNLGLRDQLAALRWVRDNIAGFGGNPYNVTVFGESAVPGSRELRPRAVGHRGGRAQELSVEDDQPPAAEHAAKRWRPEPSRSGR